MKKNLIILLTLLLCMTPEIKGDNDYTGRKLGDALTEFCKKNPDLKISFIYDELEHYKVRESAKSGDAMQVLRSLVAMNPVSLTVEGDEIYIEARQKGKYKFTGRTVDGLTGEPVRYATVLLQNPKDSTTVTYGVTDENGYFSIPCDRKNIQARFSSIGYNTLFLKSPAMNMGNVFMSVLSVKLGTMTKTAESRYSLSDRTVYVPTDREKKAAQGGSSLLRFMGIPSLIVNMNGGITTLSGEGVTVFIDYEKATYSEIEGLVPEDVKKVEIWDYPVDPRFEGVPHAVNFIMVKYEYGGYTKLSADQRLDFDKGNYSVSSKFSKGKMTYDVYTGFDHFRSTKGGGESKEFYDFGKMELERERKVLDFDMESNEVYLSGRIRYASDNKILSNNLALRYDYTPFSSSRYMNTYTPTIYPGGESNSAMSSRSLTPSWRGNYQFFLSKPLTLIVTPSFTFSHNVRDSYIRDEDVNISNNVNEQLWNASLSTRLSWKFRNHSLFMSINGEAKKDRLDYNSSNPAVINYDFQAVGAFVGGSFNFGILRLQPSVKFFYSWTHFDEEKFTQPLPGYYVSGGLNFNKRNQLNFSSEMSNWTIGVAYRSPNIVEQNKIDAVQGNPSLKCWQYNAVNLDYTCFPLPWLSIGAYASYKRHTRPMESLYRPTVINGRDMMLHTYIKDGYYQIISEGLSADVHLFDNSLYLRTTASVASHRKGGRFPFKRTVINGGFYGVYYFGKFYLQASYDFENRGVTQEMRVYDRPSSYFISLGYFIKGWNIDVNASNFFRSDYLTSYSVMDFDVYKNSSCSYSKQYRRNFWLSATYTFKYGKKIKEERIDRGSQVSSGMVY